MKIQIYTKIKSVCLIKCAELQSFRRKSNTTNKFNFLFKKPKLEGVTFAANWKGSISSTCKKQRIIQLVKNHMLFWKEDKNKLPFRDHISQSQQLSTFCNYLNIWHKWKRTVVILVLKNPDSSADVHRVVRITNTPIVGEGIQEFVSPALPKKKKKKKDFLTLMFDY